MIITNNNKKKLTMKNSLIKDAKTYKYVEYNRISCKDFYNEIFSFIKDNNNIPFRLTNEAKPDNKKKQRDKRIEFKAMIKDKYLHGELKKNNNIIMDNL